MLTFMLCSEKVEVQEAYGKQAPQRYPLDPPDPKSVTGSDASTHNRGLGGPLPHLPMSVQPGECLVQVMLIAPRQDLGSRLVWQLQGMPLVLDCCCACLLVPEAMQAV